MNKMERKNCKCECHNDGNIRHTKEDICCNSRSNMQSTSQPCQCQDEEWHVSSGIDPQYTIDKARITAVKKSYTQMNNLKKYTGCVTFDFDPKTESIDIYFRRSECEWDGGAGIQVNRLTESDKEAFRQYLKLVK